MARTRTAARPRSEDRRAVAARPRRAPLPVRRVARRVADAVGAARDTALSLVAGDRPYLAALVVLIAASAVMLTGPLRTYLAADARVETLERQLTALERENRQLAERRDDLRDPETVELLARERLGLVRPGETAFAVVPPEGDRPRIAPARPEDPAPASWYRRLWRAVTGVLDALPLPS